MDLNHFLRHFQRRRRQRRQPAIARPTAICAPSPPGGSASGAHRSERGGRSDGRRSTCPRALGRGGLWRARERWRRWPRPAGRTPRSACRAPPPRKLFDPAHLYNAPAWELLTDGPSSRQEDAKEDMTGHVIDFSIDFSILLFACVFNILMWAD